MRKQTSLWLIAFALAFMPLAAGASTQTGKIVFPIVRASDGLIYFQVDDERSAKPACATGAYFVVKAETSLSGRQQYALLLTAKEANLRISITGSNDCSRWIDGESADSVALAD